MHLLKIHKFGPIADCVMDVKNFTVLTGPQAEGKSTIAKAIYYFLCVKEIFREHISKNKNEKLSLENIANVLRTKFFGTFGNNIVNSSEMRLEYFYKPDTWIVVTADKKTQGRFSIDFKFSENFSRLIEENTHSDLSFFEVEKNFNDMLNTLEKFFDIDFKPIYIPAGRSTIASLTDYISEIFIRNDATENRMIEQNIGSCVKDYVLLILMLRRWWFFYLEEEVTLDEVIQSLKADKNTVESFIFLMKKILKGKYILKNGEEFLMTENSNSYIKMSFASSGQQEIIWVCNVMSFYLFQKVPTFLILEEPEAHLYPDSQKNISDLISFICLCRK